MLSNLYMLDFNRVVNAEQQVSTVMPGFFLTVRIEDWHRGSRKRSSLIPPVALIKALTEGIHIVFGIGNQTFKLSTCSSRSIHLCPDLFLPSTIHLLAMNASKSVEVFSFMGTHLEIPILDKTCPLRGRELNRVWHRYIFRTLRLQV